MQYSAVLVIPADMKAQADAVGAAMGWGPVSYTIPMSDDPDRQAVTHWAARADVSGQFIRWVRGHDLLPDPAFQTVIDALISDFSPDPDDTKKPALWGHAHLQTACAQHGLSLVTGV